MLFGQMNKELFNVGDMMVVIPNPLYGARNLLKWKFLVYQIPHMRSE